MMPTSATSFSSISTQICCPSSPFSAICGALFLAVLNEALPRPPRPPGITISRWPCAKSSTSTRWSALSRTTVPGGTSTTVSLPLVPCIFLPPPLSPGMARWCTFLRNPCSELMLSSAWKYTAPPLPPLPPKGPPSGTNFSRRNATIPRPPSPALMKILAVSKQRISNGRPRSLRGSPSSSKPSSLSRYSMYFALSPFLLPLPPNASNTSLPSPSSTTKSSKPSSSSSNSSSDIHPPSSSSASSAACPLPNATNLALTLGVL
mmetsp:Transcript_36465/g.89944  ORF Transcript_36465/g.89944 Transcript_36465/m.89944 type:complete len:262 (+) Transcript_36465:1348-2133(+)